MSASSVHVVMLYELVIITILLLLSPYLFAIFLKGVVICRQLTAQLQKKKGIEEAVATWQSMNPEQRMEATIRDTASEVHKDTSWLNTPSAEEEIRMMNEAVYKKGLVEPKPTVMEDDK